jgi:hypothetical protein
MKKNKKLCLTIILVLILLIAVYPQVIGQKSVEKSNKYNISHLKQTDFSAGEIIDILFSNTYPSIGEPIIIIVRFKGNPMGKRFSESFRVVDECDGIVIHSFTAQQHQSSVELYQKNISIGKLPSYFAIFSWYPVVVGNHSLQFIMGSHPAITKNISVGYSTETLIFPSIGCPSIITKDKTDSLTIVVSEQRKRNDTALSIEHTKLSIINGSDTYMLNNHSIQYKTWVCVDEHTVSDIMIVSYNVSTLSTGFYNIALTTKKNIYEWSHAVKIVQSDPESFRFVQLTDIHIGKLYSLRNEKQRLIDIFTYLNDEIQPDFIVLTGDSVDWYNANAPRNFFIDVQEAIQHSKVPVFVVPGNHDRYQHRLLMLYSPYFDLSSYHQYLNPILDYSWQYGGVNFIFLDSGYDYSRWEIKPNFWYQTPEASGLTHMQMYLLKNVFGHSLTNQIVMMHHPAVNDEEDRGLFSVPNTLPSGNDECIVVNRAEFITYCKTFNVSLVLSGHTHYNKVLNYLGEPVSNFFEWPVFVQTDSSTLHKEFVGGRVIEIDKGNVKRYDFVPLTLEFFFTYKGPMQE